MDRSKALPPSIPSIRARLKASDLSGARQLIRNAFKGRRRIPPRDRAEYARAAISCELPELAIKLLSNLVYPPRGSREKANSAECEAYASALATFGLGDEAIRIFDSLAVKRSPQGEINYAISHFRKWDWTTPLPRLRALVARKDLDPDLRSRALYVLSAGLVHGPARFSRAEKLLHECLRIADRIGSPKSRIEALQMLAQCAYLKGDSREAQRTIEKAETALIGRDSGFMAPIIEQWGAIISGDVERLGRSAERFQAAGYWEHARSCAYYEVLLTRSEERARRLYVGSPFHPGLRSKLARVMNWSSADFPASAEIELEHSSASLARLSRLELQTLAPAGLLGRILAGIASDFYHPPNTSQLHERVNPGERYIPVSSNQKILQAISRLRRHLGTSGSGVTIETQGGRYSLASSRPARLICPIDAMTSIRVEESRRQRLDDAFHSHEFTAAQAESVLGLRRWSTVSYLKECVEKGRLIRSGSGPKIRYRLTQA